MRLRRLELLIIGMTLAFACFIGGYFTGRSGGAVNVTAVMPQNNETQAAPGTDVPQAQIKAEEPAPDGAEDPGVSAGETREAAGSPRDSDGRININTASRSELMDLPGIGSVLSERIVEYRARNGPFSKTEDIRNVSGIGEKRYDTIKDKITVGS